MSCANDFKMMYIPALRFVESRPCEEITEPVVVEKLFRILLNGREYAVASILPGMEREFVYGFLLSNGEIDRAADVTEFEISDDGANAFVRTGVSLSGEFIGKNLRRLMPGTACGAEQQTLSTAGLSAIESDLRVHPRVLLDALKTIKENSALFRETGGVHTAALFDSSGQLVARVDDVGRHNAFDKIAGICLLRGIAADRLIAVTTGRLSSEIAGKCWRIGAPVIVSPSCATSRAIEIAAIANITLCGFARGRRLTAYTADWRIGGSK